MRGDKIFYGKKKKNLISFQFVTTLLMKVEKKGRQSKLRAFFFFFLILVHLAKFWLTGPLLRLKLGRAGNVIKL